MKSLFCCLSGICVLSFFCLSLSGCAKKTDYTEYVSEYRSEIYLAESEGYSLTAFFTAREYPYASDGVCANIENIAEIYLLVPDNTEDYDISFSTADGKNCGGDMSYDNVYARFFFSQSIEPISAPSVTFEITHEGQTIVLEAKSVKTGNELTVPDIIDKLTEEKKFIFDRLTEKKWFNGEIYIRLIYNEKCYYYAEITDTQKQTDSFLLDAYTGEVLAERTWKN